VVPERANAYKAELGGKRTWNSRRKFLDENRPLNESGFFHVDIDLSLLRGPSNQTATLARFLQGAEIPWAAWALSTCHRLKRVFWWNSGDLCSHTAERQASYFTLFRNLLACKHGRTAQEGCETVKKRAERWCNFCNSLCCKWFRIQLK
jgi:hypothetical protein